VPPDGECAAEINSKGYPAINGLLTGRLSSLSPTGGMLKNDFEALLIRIADAINAHIKNLNDQRNLEECLLSGDLAKCPNLSNQSRPAAELSQEAAQERKDELAEFALLKSMAFAIRNVLSPRPRHEEWRSVR
jgi:hypothetical protein